MAAPAWAMACKMSAPNASMVPACMSGGDPGLSGRPSGCVPLGKGKHSVGSVGSGAVRFSGA